MPQTDIDDTSENPLLNDDVKQEAKHINFNVITAQKIIVLGIE